MIAKEIYNFLEEYFLVLQNQDIQLFDKVFNQSCILYSQQDGNTIIRPFAEYRTMVQARKSPQETGSPRQEEILMMDILSPNMVTVKVRLRLFDSIMEDHLNLMKVDGCWSIFAKHFHRVGSAV